MAELEHVEAAIFERLRAALPEVTVERFVGEPIEAAEEAGRKVRGSIGVVLLLYGGTAGVDRDSGVRTRESVWMMIVGARNVRTDAQAQSTALALIDRLVAAMDGQRIPLATDGRLWFVSDRLISIDDAVAAYETAWVLNINQHVPTPATPTPAA